MYFGVERLIVDVRDNPGGLLTSVCDVLDSMLPEELLVYTEDKNGKKMNIMQQALTSLTSRW